MEVVLCLRPGLNVLDNRRIKRLARVGSFFSSPDSFVSAIDAGDSKLESWLMDFRLVLMLNLLRRELDCSCDDGGLLGFEPSFPAIESRKKSLAMVRDVR